MTAGRMVSGPHNATIPFAQQEGRMTVLVRTIGLARAEAKVGIANLLYNIKRKGWLDRRAAPA